jgi:hypothetical protein
MNKLLNKCTGDADDACHRHRTVCARKGRVTGVTGDGGRVTGRRIESINSLLAACIGFRHLERGHGIVCRLIAVEGGTFAN